MKIVSWNVNGLRASIKNSGTDLKGLLDRLDADIICFQETKAQRDQLDSSMYMADGYSAYFSFCRTKGGYSGVVTFCRDSATPVAAEEGLTGSLSADRLDTVKCYGQWEEFSPEELASLDSEGRAVLTEHTIQLISEDGEDDDSRSSHRQLVVVNVYCPMVDVDRGIDPDRLDYKLKFYAALQERCTALEKAGKIVIAAGDFNCSKEPIDSAKILDDPDRLRNSPSRDWMQQFVTINPSHPCKDTNSTELVDSFRYLHPSQEKAYTCWSTLLDSRKINYGTRIDYILLSKSLAGHLRKAEVWQEVEGSDHCPVFTELAMELVASSQPSRPSLCSSNFSAGKQKKLSDFLRAGQKSSGSGSGLAASAKVSLGKRKSGSTVDQTSAAKTRKMASGGKKKVDSKQSLASFFKPVSEQKQQSNDQPADNILKDNVMEDDSITSSEESRTASQEERPSTDTDSSSQSDTSANSGRKLSQAWKGVFGGPPKPPLCKGHSEPCVLRTVKKQGPNKNKQFWVCARPGGGKGDPEARCDFFQWKSAKQK